MFQDLDATLEKILDQPLAPAFLRAALVSFETPDKNYNPTANTVNLFLLEAKENREERDPEPIIELDAFGAYVRKRPPIRVDCIYLVTAWSTQSGSLQIQEEHRLLAFALAWLSRYPTIPVGVLQGSMVTQPFPLHMRVGQSDERVNVSEFWNALGIFPRAWFGVSVTISMELNIETPEGQPVVTKEMVYEKLLAPETLGVKLAEGFQIAGVVTALVGGALVAGATVIVLENGLTARSDAQGHFTLSNLNPGSYTLRATAAGFSQTDHAITVPGAVLNEYDIKMAS